MRLVDGEVAGDAVHAQAVTSQGRERLAPGDKPDVVAGLSESPAEISADRTGADDRNSHRAYCDRFGGCDVILREPAMFCPACGARILDSAYYCRACSRPLVASAGAALPAQLAAPATKAPMGLAASALGLGAVGVYTSFFVFGDCSVSPPLSWP
ncbi:MAG: YgiT-type zinc finger protein [Bryobacterales bacterium]